MNQSNGFSIAQCLTPEQALQLDRIAIERLGISGLVLMENAAIRCVEILAQRYSGARMLVLCGTGNNGGDGLVIARQWAVRDESVTVWISGTENGMSPDCAANWKILSRLELPNLKILPEQSPIADSCELQPARPTLIVDALLGISAKGVPRSPMAETIVWANQIPANRVAIDIPTGLDPEIGQAHEPVFRAELTLTIERPKTFALNPKAQQHYGELVVVPLGIPSWIAAEAKLHTRKPDHR